MCVLLLSESFDSFDLRFTKVTEITDLAESALRSCRLFKHYLMPDQTASFLANRVYELAAYPCLKRTQTQPSNQRYSCSFNQDISNGTENLVEKGKDLFNTFSHVTENPTAIII